MAYAVSADTVSIIMPAYNSASTINESIKSAIGQSYEKIEVIIVDDGSTDNTAEICKHNANSDSRIRFISQRNGGVSAARNTGIRMATGEYIAFLDSDDLWDPKKIEIQYSACKANNNSIILTDFQRFSDEGTSRKLLSKTSPPVFSHKNDYIRKILNLDNNEMAAFGTALVSKIHLEQYGAFDEKLKSSEDWELWLRLAFHYPFVNINQPLRLYRKHSGSLTTRTNLKNTLRGQLYVIQKYATTGELSAQEIRSAKARKYSEFAGFFWGRKMRFAAVWSAINAIVSSPGEVERLFRKFFGRK